MTGWVADAFVELTGHPPTGVWTAPGRVNLIGEHTDYNQGLVLPFAIEARTEVAAGARHDGVVRVTSRQRPGEVIQRALADLRPQGAEGWSAYALGPLWAIGQGHPVGGVDLVLDGQVPPGSGLSSSASLECAVALAVAELHDLTLSREQLAEAAQRAENEFVGVPTGPMDQRASMLCTEGHALLLDTRDMTTTQVPLEPDRGELALVVIDSQVRHRHADGAYADRRRGCEAACRILGVPALRDITEDGLDAALAELADAELGRRVRHVVTEDVRTRATVEALRAGDWARVGQALTASHTSLRDDYEVSCAELDTLVAAATDAGALGARMTGGGFGGAAVVLVAAAQVPSVTATVAEAFRRRGFSEPTSMTTRPSAGASRIA